MRTEEYSFSNVNKADLRKSGLERAEIMNKS